MADPTRALHRILALALILSTLSCSRGASLSGSGTGPVTPAMNVAAVTVDSGPDPTNSATVNTLYTTVTICVPGSTTQCQTIDNIQVDTGSYGFRVLSSALSLTLPVTTATDGNMLGECTVFVDGYSWGPIASADIQVAGETAASVPIQVIGDANFAAVPASCSSASTGMAEDTVGLFGANGILGIGVFEQDCGPSCAGTTSTGAAPSGDPPVGFYYSCSQATCQSVFAPLTIQVLNPVPLFAKDNNGVIIQLPSVAAPGAATVSGSLIFGIDTQTNNASGTQTLLTLDADDGTFTTVFNGQTLSGSFIDSGTNGIFFNDAGILPCSDMNFNDFYCPASTLSLSATLTGQNSQSINVTFDVGNAQSLFANSTLSAFPTLGGTYPGTTPTFDWGLPFFYGRRVAFAIEAHTTSVGTGPYVAF